MMKKRLTNIIVSSMIGLASLIPFKQAYAEIGGWGKFAGYYDSRKKPTATFTGGAYGLPLGSELFGFVEMETEKSNLEKPYTELSLSKKSGIGLGVAVEYNRDFSPLPNGIILSGVTRLGVVYERKNKKNELIGCKFYPAATQNNGMQAVFYGNKRFNKGDVVIDWFFDYNFKPREIVTELQVGKRLQEGLYWVVEGRYNGFKESDSAGVGLGLEWRF